MKELERENVRLKRAVAELTLDKQILKEAAEGKYLDTGGGGGLPAIFSTGLLLLTAGGVFAETPLTR
jgi:hypothetical protein